MPVPGYVALVLHAHLPWAADAPADRIARRWLLGALWESYLPLLEVLDRLAAEGIAAGLSLSISPPLAAMLKQRGLTDELNQHLRTVATLNSRQAAGRPDDPLAQIVALYEDRIEHTLSTWKAIDGDLLSALDEHRLAGRVDLLTSSATHALLPGHAHHASAVRAQLRIGRRAFARHTGHLPVGLWLPECAYDERLAPLLAQEGVGYTVVDGHGLELGRPRPAAGAATPVLCPEGVAFFGRDRSVSRQVWSRAMGYPGDPAYRDFYRDVGLDLPDSALVGLGAGTMTGLKYYRITGRGRHKLPYDPAAAAARIDQHADHFVAACAARLASIRHGGSPPVVVAAYDAELFGHWWFEGPAFVEGVLRRLASSAELEPITLAQYLARHPRCPVVQPAGSTWGEGGHGRAWMGPEAAPLWRHMHRAHQEVTAAVRRHRHATGPAGASLDQAIRELLLLQSSDWAFMIRGGDVAAYGHERFERHRANVYRQLQILATSAMEIAEDASCSQAIPAADDFLRELSADELRNSFDG